MPARPDIHLTAANSLLAAQSQMAGYVDAVSQTEGISAAVVDVEAQWPAEAFVNRRDLGRGVSWALAIEGLAALGCYAAWHLWRLWF